MLNKLKILLFTFCFVMTFLAADAASSQIISTGVRKVSDNTINFTFYTSGDNLEKPIVKSKGDNEYTILLPNMSDSTSRALNIGATDGIVTSADVKTINEGAVTYTKINLKTSKPVTINAEMKKTAQTVSDSSSINNIVSKVNLINQDIQNTKNISDSSYSAPSQSVVKVSSVKDIIRQNSASAPKRNAIQEAVAVNSVSAHTPSVKKLDKSVNNKANSENIRNTKPVAAKPVSKPAENTTPADNASTVQNAEAAAVANLVDVDAAVPSDDDMMLSKIDESEFDNQIPVHSGGFSFVEGVKNVLFSPFTTIVLLSCLLLAFFGFLFRKLTANLSATKSINDSFIERLNGVLNKPKDKDFSKIVNNDKMTWQEKYRAFNKTNSESEKTETKEINNDYVFELNNEQSDADIVENEEEIVSEEITSSVEKNEEHKPAGFTNSILRPVSGIKPVKSSRLKSFDNTTVSKKSLKEKLDKIAENDSQNNQKPYSHATNTISKHPNPDNMRIMQSSAIDKDKEFYIVNENGEYSLLGRVKNRLVILKRFGKTAPSDLQVHRGAGNDFVVKAGSFRTQVNVTDTDMNIYSQV